MGFLITILGPAPNIRVAARLREKVFTASEKRFSPSILLHIPPKNPGASGQLSVGCLLACFVLAG